MKTVYTILDDRSKMWRGIKDREERRLLDCKLRKMKRMFEREGIEFDAVFSVDHVPDRGLGLSIRSKDAITVDAIERLLDVIEIDLGKLPEELEPLYSGKGHSPFEDLIFKLDPHLALTKRMRNEVASFAERKVRERHSGPSGLDKDEALRNFLSANSGPLQLKGPTTPHEIDEMIARVHARAPWLRRATERVWKGMKARLQASDEGGLSFPADPASRPPRNRKESARTDHRRRSWRAAYANRRGSRIVRF